MSFYDQRESFGQYNNYQSDSRRNSNSFSEEQSSAKRKKTYWTRKRGGNSSTPRNTTVHAPLPEPLFKEPSAHRNRSPMLSTNTGRYNRGGYRDNSFRSGGNQPYFDMRDVPDFVEPEHSGTQWHWDNYFNDCKSWQDKHKLAYYRSRCVALEFENQMLFEQISSLIEENCVFAVERGAMPSMRLPEIPGRQRSQSERGDQASNTQTPKKQGKNRTTSTTSDTEIEFEVTEDMMKFLEKSIRHKLNLKKKRNQEAAKTKTEEDLKKKETESKVGGPKLPMGLKRKEELDLLYGANSALIHGLETSIQLNFNRNCDTYKPELWMAVPLNPETVTA